MEGIEFGSGFATTLFIFDLLLTTIKVVVTFLITHFVSKLLVPHVASRFGFSNKLTGSSRFYFFCYTLSFLMMAPVVQLTISVIFVYCRFNMDSITPFFHSFTEGFPSLKYYLLALAIWQFDENLEHFKLNTTGKIIVKGIVFSLTIYVVGILERVFHESNFPAFISMNVLPLFYPMTLIALTLFYVSRNKQASSTNSSPLIEAKP